jgi:preprotein translocase subunit SecA
LLDEVLVYYINCRGNGSCCIWQDAPDALYTRKGIVFESYIEEFWAISMSPNPFLTNLERAGKSESLTEEKENKKIDPKLANYM